VDISPRTARFSRFQHYLSRIVEMSRNHSNVINPPFRKNARRQNYIATLKTDNKTTTQVLSCIRETQQFVCLPHCAGAEHCSDQKCETLRKMHSIMPRSRSHGRVDASQASRPPWDGISTIKCKLLGEKLCGKLALHIESGVGTRERQLL
jgi:hypothetical protein